MTKYHYTGDPKGPDGGVEDAVVLGILQGVGQVLALARTRPNKIGHDLLPKR